MIIKITFLDINRKPFTMLFGDSYKLWHMQYEEFMNEQIKWYDCSTLIHRKIYGIVSVEKSSDEWIGWGGLKWCGEECFQEQLNREGCQEGEPDNPKPRLYNRMQFESNKKIEKIVRDYYRHRLRNLVN